MICAQISITSHLRCFTKVYSQNRNFKFAVTFIAAGIAVENNLDPNN